MIEIKGKSGIVVKVLADSVSEAGNRLMTYELTYPRIIHSELLTHKMLCSNSASSRAIPFNKMAEQLTAKPVRFGQANPGMQDKGEDYNELVEFYDPYSAQYIKVPPEQAWEWAKSDALGWSKAFHKAGYHKQVYNRLTETSQRMKTVISGTEWGNFFWLRNDSAADPTLHELARCMSEAHEQSVPQLLKTGQYHLPYVYCDFGDTDQYYIGPEHDMEFLTVDQAIKVSCARTAAVSFRNEDYSLAKCLEVYDRLIGDERKHSSAMQHAATPMQKNHTVINEDACGGDYVNAPENSFTWQDGVSHATRDGKLWSAQFCGFIMHRKTIPGENYIG